MDGIEPTYAAWKAAVLPLNYTREGLADNRSRTGLSRLDVRQTHMRAPFATVYPPRPGVG